MPILRYQNKYSSYSFKYRMVMPSKRYFSMDVVLVSDARTPELLRITQNAINTAGRDVDIIVVESNNAASYSGAKVIYPTIPFNYNAYLNIGAAKGSSDYIFFGNNDIIFSKSWKDNIIDAMKKHDVVSASPICPTIATLLKTELNSGVLFGYDLISRFCGWAFVWTREFYAEVDGLDEYFTFWCSDNAAVEQLAEHNKEHILVTSSVVQHLSNGRNTLKLVDSDVFYKYTTAEIQKFNRKFNKNLYLSPHFKIFSNNNIT